jgi:hypothetical protein
VRKLTRHFDNLIRTALVNAHETANYARRLAGTVDSDGA